MDFPDSEKAAVARLEEAVFAGLRAERGWRAWLRERSRGARLGVIAAVVALEALVAFVVARRVDWGAYPLPRMALAMIALAGATLLLGWLALRPVWMRPLPRWVAPAAGLVALGVPLSLALLPELPTAPPFDDVRGMFALRCFAIGCALGTAVLLVARLVDRGGTARWPAVAAAMAGGLSGALALQVECPVNHPWHLVAGHALPVVALGVVGWVVRRRR
jgi:hypothetical protein